MPENEFSMMTWAARAGVCVPEFELVDSSAIEGLPPAVARIRKGACYAVRRFDRAPSGRVHIEDFAQVFSVYPERKYDSFYYESVANVIAETCGPSCLREYIRRLVFMVLSGNADML